MVVRPSRHSASSTPITQSITRSLERMGRIASPLDDGDSMLRPARIPNTERDSPRHNRNGLKRSRIKRESKGHKAEVAKYNASAAAFFAQNPDCLICIRLREAGDNIVLRKATERHHLRGRIGRLLNWRPGWIASCFHHRLWPHNHPTRARQLGLLAPAHLWEVFPDEGK